jgi:hypothetical protein
MRCTPPVEGLQVHQRQEVSGCVQKLDRSLTVIAELDRQVIDKLVRKTAGGHRTYVPGGPDIA